MLELDGGGSDISTGLAADCALQAGNVVAARRFLQMKRDAPCGHWARYSARCTTGLQAALRQTAKDLQLGCVDLPGLLTEAAEDGIPGFDWFLDYCHLSSKGTVLAMAHTAAAVARTLGLAAPEPDCLRAARPAVAPDVEAAAHVLAAIHASHLRQPDECVGRLLGRAAAFSREATAGLMIDYLDGHLRACPTGLTASFARLTTNAQARCYFGDAGQVANMKLAKFSLASIAQRVLGDEGATLDVIGDAAAIHGVGQQPLDLLHPGRSRDHVMDDWIGSPQAYDVRYDPTSSHAFHVAEPVDLEFRVVLRLPDSHRLPASVSLTLNGGTTWRLELTPRWQTHSWTVPAAESQPGLNVVEIAWPDPQVDYARECALGALALERMSPRHGGAARGHLAAFTVRRR
jgi:hypothetical protein